MIKLPLSQLEEARRNPAHYRSQIGKPKGFIKRGYYGVLRDAVRQFHKNRDSAVAGHAYLEDNLDQFNNASKSLDTVNQLAWYVDDYLSRGWITTETYRHVVVPIEDPAVKVICTGEISRFDYVPAGGYAAWLFRSKNPEGWKSELRMPIIQDIAAKRLGVPLAEIRVGVISFQDRFSEHHSFNENQIVAAYEELVNLLRLFSA